MVGVGGFGVGHENHLVWSLTTMHVMALMTERREKTYLRIADMSSFALLDIRSIEPSLMEDS